MTLFFAPRETGKRFPQRRPCIKMPRERPTSSHLNNNSLSDTISERKRRSPFSWLKLQRKVPRWLSYKGHGEPPAIKGVERKTAQGRRPRTSVRGATKQAELTTFTNTQPYSFLSHPKKLKIMFLWEAVFCYFPVFIIKVILSPFKRMRPTGRRVFFFTDISSASSNTKFMYSSKPRIRPSMRRSACS